MTHYNCDHDNNLYTYFIHYAVGLIGSSCQMIHILPYINDRKMINYKYYKIEFS